MCPVSVPLKVCSFEHGKCVCLSEVSVFMGGRVQISTERQIWPTWPNPPFPVLSWKGFGSLDAKMRPH